MAQFATASDLSERLGIELTAAEQTRATSLLATASGLVQSEAGQTIELVEDDTLALPGTSDERVKLPERPVVSVASVTLDGTVLVEGSDWYLDGNTIVRMGDPLFGGVTGYRGFGAPWQTLEVIYTHGFEEIPEPIKAICLEAAVRVWVNPGSVMSERVGAEQTMYLVQGTPTGLLLTSDERRVIRRLFGRAGGSVTIR